MLNRERKRVARNADDGDGKLEEEARSYMGRQNYKKKGGKKVNKLEHKYTVA